MTSIIKVILSSGDEISNRAYVKAFQGIYIYLCHGFHLMTNKKNQLSRESI